jgi:uncharacterized protein
MKLDLDRQAPGRSDLPVSGNLELGMPEGGPGTAEVAGTLLVQNLESRVLLAGTLQARGTAECGRCLNDFTIAWDVPVDLQVLRDVDTDETEGETLLILQQKGEVDLREAVRECAVLGYPQAPVCSEECKGLCPDCGIDRNKDTCSCEEQNVDPRWDGLPE